MLDSTGHPIITYQDNTNGDLKLVHCSDATCTSGNSIQTVDRLGKPFMDASLALDSSGHPVISYFDPSNNSLKLAHCGDTTCSSGNSIQTVDSSGFVGVLSALVLDSNGHPVISYIDFSNYDIKLVYCGNATCSADNIFRSVDRFGNSGDPAQKLAMALDSSGHPVISYVDSVNRDLKLAHCGDATCSSGNSIQTVDSAGDVGFFTTLLLDSAGHPVMSYLDYTNRDLKLAHCGDATCSSGNSIQIVDSAGMVGEYDALALDSNGHPVISYWDSTNRDLKLAQCGDATCAIGNTIQTVASDAIVFRIKSPLS